jgi:hypothetical protein
MVWRVSAVLQLLPTDSLGGSRVCQWWWLAEQQFAGARMNQGKVDGSWLLRVFWWVGVVPQSASGLCCGMCS